MPPWLPGNLQTQRLRFSRRQPGPYPERGAPGVSPHAAISYNKKKPHGRSASQIPGASGAFMVPRSILLLRGGSHTAFRVALLRDRSVSPSPTALEPAGAAANPNAPTHSGRKEEKAKLFHIHPPPPPPHSLLLAFSRLSKQQVLGTAAMPST